MGRKRRMSASSRKYWGPRKPSSPSRGIQGQHGQIDPPAPERLRIPPEVRLHVPVPGGVLALPVPPVQIPGMKDRPAFRRHQKGHALVGGGQCLHGDAGQGRGALPAGKHPAVRGGFFRESPFLPVPVCQMDALAKKESDIPLPVIQSKNPGIKVVWMAMAGKDQQGA